MATAAGSSTTEARTTTHGEAPPEPATQLERAPGSEAVLLTGISWPTYVALREELDEAGSHLRLTYDRGSLEIMSPGVPHEWSKSLFGRMVEALTEELNIPIRSGGSATFRKQLLEKGLEPDECYWVQRELQVRARKRLDLEIDPVPDLAIEVEVSHTMLERLPIYAALGFAEVWRYDGERLHVIRFGPDGASIERDRSEIFPFLPIADLLRFLDEAERSDETTWIRAFRAWVRDEIAPRRDAEIPGDPPGPA